MLLNFFPPYLESIFNKLNIDKLFNINLRVNQPILCNYNSSNYYLTQNGISKECKKSIVCDEYLINYIIKKVTENSIYAYNEQIKQGFLTTKNGVRIGLSGTCVFDKDSILTIKDFTSLNVRIPHEIHNCSNKIFTEIFNCKNIYNSLIISPPGCGKTTILKDLTNKINKKLKKNILIIDERGEFNQIEGEYIDKLSYSNKLFAFNNGIRALSPYLIITDELFTNDDWLLIKKVISSGLKICASVHSDSIDSLKNNQYFIPNLFERYFVLDNQSKPGVLKSVYKKDFAKIC